MFTSLRDNTDTMVSWLGGIMGATVLVIGLALLVLVLAAVISALFNNNTTGGGKLLWILFILWVPLFGAVTWFVVGKKGYLNRLLGIDKGRARHTAPSSVGQHSNLSRDQAGQGGGTGEQPGHGSVSHDQFRQGGAPHDQSGAGGMLREQPREPGQPAQPGHPGHPGQPGQQNQPNQGRVAPGQWAQQARSGWPGEYGGVPEQFAGDGASNEEGLGRILREHPDRSGVLYERTNHNNNHHNNAARGQSEQGYA